MEHNRVERNRVDRGYSREALTEDERAELRQMLASYRREAGEYQEMLEYHRRKRWLVGTLNRLAIAIGAVVGTITAVKGFLGNYWR